MTPDEIKAEIAEARRIIREDKLIASHREIREKLDKHFPDAPETGNPPNPDQPPAPEPKDPPDNPPKKRSGWWGDAIPD